MLFPIEGTRGSSPDIVRTLRLFVFVFPIPNFRAYNIRRIVVCCVSGFTTSSGVLKELLEISVSEVLRV